MTELTCDQCGATIDEADAADAGWLDHYKFAGVYIKAPICDVCRKYFVQLDELGRLREIDPWDDLSNSY